MRTVIGPTKRPNFDKHTQKSSRRLFVRVVALQYQHHTVLSGVDNGVPQLAHTLSASANKKDIDDQKRETHILSHPLCLQ